MGIKVPSGKDMYCEAAACMTLPGEQLIPAYTFILGSGEDSNRAVQRFVLPEAITLHHRNIGTQNRQKDFHERVIFQKLLRDSIIAASQLLNKVTVRERVQKVGTVRRIRRATAGKKYPVWHGMPLALQYARPLEGEQCTHAVSEDCEGHVQPGPQFPVQGIHQRFYLGEQDLGETRFPSGQQNWAYLYKRRQFSGPGMICGGAASRMRQAEQAHTRIPGSWG